MAPKPEVKESKPKAVAAPQPKPAPVPPTVIPHQPVAAATPEPEVAADKRIKALRKKLREIEELNARDHATLSAEQVEKLNRKASLEEELSTLSLGEK